MIESLGNELSEDEAWEANLYTNKHGCKTTSRYD